MKIISAKNQLEKRQNRFGYVFIAPWIVGFILFFFIPFVQSIWFAFCKVTISENGFETRYIALNNFNYLFNLSETYVNNLKTSVGQFLYSLPLIVILSLILGLILNQKFRGRLLARAIFFLPVIIASGVVMEIFNSDIVAAQMRESGSQVNAFIGESVDFSKILMQLSLPQTMAEPILQSIQSIFDLIWSCGVQTILFIAGLQAIPDSLYEASHLEGATSWEDFWFITLPMLMNVFVLVVVFTIIDIFTNSNNPVMEEAYQLMMVSQNYDRSSAVLWSYFLIVGVFIALVMWIIHRFFLKKWEA